MQVNEVRIGNIVAIPALSNQHTAALAKQIKAITLFGEFDFSTKNCQEIYPAQHCSGVQLSTTWLTRMGFSEKGATLFVKDGFEIQHNGPEFHLRFFNCKIMFVHQLQNAYYLKTGEELTIKNLQASF